MSIQNLAQGALTVAASVPFYDPVNGADKRASITSLVELIQSLLTASGGLITQYSAPAATGFSVTIAPVTSGASVLLLLTPAAGYAAGTITLPAVALCQDGQQVRVSCTQAVATLTTAGNGATVNGAPTALTANSFFTLRFNGVLAAWYRVG